MAKRIAQSSVNWTALAERVPAEQKVNLSAFKLKSEKYLRRVMAFPEEAPKINWEQYKKIVPIPGMVDNFQKQYQALKIPYPADKDTSKVDAQWVEVKKAIEAFVQDSNTRIAQHEKEIKETKALLPFTEMTMEDLKDSNPELVLDPVNRPTYWPHDEEEQKPDPPPVHH